MRQEPQIGIIYTETLDKKVPNSRFSKYLQMSNYTNTQLVLYFSNSNNILF